MSRNVKALKQYTADSIWEEQNPSYLLNDEVLIKLQKTIAKIKKKKTEGKDRKLRKRNVSGKGNK